MKPLVALAAVSLLLAAITTANTARAADAAVEKPIHQMMDGFNTGNIKAVKAAHVAAPTIIDETQPYYWSGPKGFDSWIAQLSKNEAAEGKTDGVVWFGDPVRESVSGDHAYVFTPCSYTFKQKGQKLREDGTITFVLVKHKAGWKIGSWTWTSPEGKPVN